MLSRVGTEIYKAPELVQGKDFNEKIDIWGAGCMLGYLLTGLMTSNGIS
jgi:serine/threonine protein kinase